MALVYHELAMGKKQNVEYVNHPTYVTAFLRRLEPIRETGISKDSQCLYSVYTCNIDKNLDWYSRV